MTFWKLRSRFSIERRDARANRLRERGHFERAIDLFKKNYKECVRRFGPTHTITLNAKNSLAIALRSAGSLDEAAALFHENYIQRLEEDGPSSHDTIVARGNLARTYIDLDRFEEAVPLLKLNFDNYLDTVGPHDPRTLSAQSSLAVAYREAGNITEAISLLDSLLSFRLSTVGSDSLDTLAARNDLALTYQRAQRYDKAIPLLRENFVGYERILGPNAPQTVRALHNLMSVCQSAPDVTGSDRESTSSNNDTGSTVFLQSESDETPDTVKEHLDAICDSLRSVRGNLDMLLERSCMYAFDDLRARRIIFGGRPDVAAGSVERWEQARLFEFVINQKCVRTVLMGMRGCGKSQLASKLTQWCEDHGWNLVAWINASSPASTKSDLSELANRLGVDTRDNPSEDQLIRRGFDYLESSDPSDRLIVFDNVESSEDLTDLVPHGVGLRVVATSRSRHGWKEQGWESLDVGVFPREESVAYLLEVVGSQDAEAADAVAGRLGDLPLALAQAAATASNEGSELKRYLERLEKYSSKQTIHPVPGDSYTRDVSSALRLAVDSALDRIGDGLRGVARLQVGALAVLAESGVPTRWLDPLMKEDTGADESNEDTGGDAAVEDADAHLALTALTKASVVQQSADGRVTMLHRLQAQVLRENWNDGERAEAFDAAADLLDRVNIDSLPRSNAEGRRREARDLIDQLRAIAAQGYSHPLFERGRVVAGLPHAFFHARDLGLPNEALALRGAVSAVEEVLGAEHPGTLASRSGLAGACRAAGRLGEAIPLYEQVLADSARVLGADHPHTLTSRNNLAGAYESAGRLGEAIPLYEEVLADTRRVLGEVHPDTLASRNNLAGAYYAVGRLTEAITLYEQVLTDSIRVLGKDHPDTLTSRNNLAGAYESAGHLTEAITLYEQVLTDRIRVLGKDHPDTLTSRNNLAGAYESAGRLTEAITLYEQVLTDRIRVLGEDHPDTLTTRNDLAYAYHAAGRLEEAITLYEQVLPDRIRVLGEDHPDTLASRNNLAYAYYAAGRLTEAITLFEQVLLDRIRVLGEDHPGTLTSRNNLAGAYRAVGRLTEAITLYEQVTRDCARVLGEDHPLTKTVRENLEGAKRKLQQQEKESPAD